MIIGTAPDCYACTMNAASELPARERVYDADGWRVAHAFNSSLPGWLCVLPRRHLDGLHELDDAEAAALGRLLRALSVALVEVTGCAKTYVMLFAEQQGFAHLHVHVVPRPVDLEPALQGPRVFGYLDREALTDADRDSLARELTPAVARALAG